LKNLDLKVWYSDFGRILVTKKIVKEIIEEQKLSQSNIKWLKKNEKLTEKQLLEEFEGYSEKSLWFIFLLMRNAEFRETFRSTWYGSFLGTKEQRQQDSPSIFMIYNKTTEKFEKPFPYIWLFCFFLAFINTLTKDFYNESIYFKVGFLFGAVLMTTVIAYLITIAFFFLVDRFIPDKE
tara:strand:- start:1469 stop:2005 length:537 start_codon:yes stop_codon:yes gene_type:complete